MISTLLQMSVLIGCGVLWRTFSLGGLTAEQARPVLTTLVYFLLLPAMVLEVLWQADIGLHSLQLTAFGIACIVFGMLTITLCGRLLKFKNRQMGAMLLATAFPNVTYLGLPVLEQTFGPWAKSIAIQLDFFASAPFLFTAGIFAAQHYGSNNSEKRRPVLSFLFTPPFLAAIAAVFFNINHIPQPALVAGIMQKLSAGVVPLMLISLGLALNWRSVNVRNLPYIVPVVIIKMGLMPLFALGASKFLTLDSSHKAAAVLEMAMPSMVLGIVFCDRYRLDSSLYAMAVTVTTLLTLITLPFWYAILTR